MNRAERRQFFRKARLEGIPKGAAQVYYEAIEANQRSPTNDIEDGAKVKINVDQITGNKNYHRMIDEYKEFVEEARDREFIAHIQNGLVRLEGVAKWLFWAGDLISCEEIKDE